ncbi:MAG: pyruvate formate lyase family protein, partial [Actinomycetota bacterium]|nr:pyruvate formate lyase family protein [Actinomycetota bacterium]
MDITPGETEEIVKQDSPRIKRLKERLLTAPYEICLERAKHFTKVYKETEGMNSALRNALALKATLENQPVHIYEDEWIVGNKTDKFLSPVIAPERGDSLRELELDLDILSQKQKPFHMSPQDKKMFLEEIIPYWEGKSVRDRKAEYWLKSGIIEPVRGNPIRTVRQIADIVKFAKHTDPASLKLIAGIREGQKSDPKRALLAWKIRDEVSKNNPNMAVYCYDVQGHLHLGVDKVVNEGFEGIAERAKKRLAQLDRGDSDFQEKEAFLKSVIISMEAACTYAERTRKLAEEMAEKAKDPQEVERLRGIAKSLSHAPARGARNFREAVQSTWFALLIGEIQYGMHDVLGIGR